MICGFVLSIAAASPLLSQQVPGRDLLQFPIGSLAEAPALASATGDGLANPTSVLLPAGARFRISASALQTPAEQSVAAHAISIAAMLPAATSVGISLVRAAVSDILLTTSDPQSIGGEVPYGTTLISAAVARQQERVSVGLAVRYRTGEIDGRRESAVGLDAGLIASRIPLAHARVAVSSFLWRPANRSDEQTTFNAALDARLIGSGETNEARAGYSASLTEGVSAEHYGFLSARSGVWAGRGGLARTDAYGRTNWRLRLGIGLHYANYIVGVAREETGAGLDPFYQFSLSALIR